MDSELLSNSACSAVLLNGCYDPTVVLKAQPNPAHYALTKLQCHPLFRNQKPAIVTQNVDGLHILSGSDPSSTFEIHGSLFRTRCSNSHCPGSKYENEQTNRDFPIAPAFVGKGQPDVDPNHPTVPQEQLPHCEKCNSLLRPAVIWFGENLNPTMISAAHAALAKADLLFVVGTSGVVYPAAGFADIVMGNGGDVIEVNVERTREDEERRKGWNGKERGGYLFVEGKCEEVLPELVDALEGFVGKEGQ